MSVPVQIVCVGSPLGDDCVGMRLAPLLEGLFDPSEVRVSCHDRPGVRLLECMEGAPKVVLVDGVISGAPPGTLHRVEGEAIFAQLARHTSTHAFGLAEAVALAVPLGFAPQALVLHGVEIETVRADAGLSAAVEAALPRLAAVVRAEVARSLSEV
jgi:hydrogenase maturation protease